MASSPAPARSLPLDLARKTALITGSTRGIGAAIALRLARRGAAVVLNHSSSSPAAVAAAEALRAQIAALGTGAKAVVVAGSVAEKGVREAMVQRAVELSKEVNSDQGGGFEGKIDVLVQNAGCGDDRYLGEVDEAFWDGMVGVNLKAPFFLTQAALPHLARGGRIVLVSSVSARMGVPQQSVYAATKAGLEAFARVWAAELGQKHGVTVNCVAPGPVATDMWHASSEEFLREMEPLVRATPAEGRVGEVGDVVPVVSFLCSEESRWVTGSVISASGGLLFI